MKVLLDTNIVIHRETSRIINEDVFQLFMWLDKLKYDKVLHPVTETEIYKHKGKDILKLFQGKLQAYVVLQNKAPLHTEVMEKIIPLDRTENDINDTLLINEVFCDRVDLLITEDKNIHKKPVCFLSQIKFLLLTHFSEEFFQKTLPLLIIKFYLLKRPSLVR